MASIVWFEIPADNVERGRGRVFAERKTDFIPQVQQQRIHGGTLVGDGLFVGGAVGLKLFEKFGAVGGAALWPRQWP